MRSDQPFDPRGITRPDPALMRFYLITSLFTGPLFPLTALALYFRYRTLRYAFDDDGISMRWGILFRREINLTYRRIQDIHVSRNVIQRWMGLANVAIQTASGSAGPEMTIEGVLEPDGLRDFLYSKMRGAKDDADEDATATDTAARPADEALALLVEIRDALARIAPKQEEPS